MRTAILGWGSLIWESRPDFDDQHLAWESDGPTLPLEFSRVSRTRLGALTLVLDRAAGQRCRVAHARSKRSDPEDVICDLRSREGTVRRHIGYLYTNGSRSRGREAELVEAICTWAQGRTIDAVVWTDLPSNFQETCGSAFSVEGAIRHVASLSSEGKARASEYVWRAPEFVDTPLRRALQAQSWFEPPR